MRVILFCIGLLCIYYGICAFSLLCDDGLTRLKKLYVEISLSQKLIAIITILFTLILTLYWMKQNHFIYFWDYAGYWSISIDWMNFIFNNTLSDTVHSLMDSINYYDYNNFLPTIIALPMKLFGCSFSQYVFIVHIMFLLPATFIQALSSLKLVSRNNSGGRKFVIALALASLFPANYYAMYLGYIDVAILLPISILIYLFIDYDFCSSSAVKDIAIALMLILVWISRRYAVYFNIGYVAGLSIKAIELLIKKRNVSALKRVIFHFVVIGGLSLGILMLFFRTFLMRAVFTDYRGMYTAYDASIFVKITKLVSSFGYLSAIIVVLTGILCFVLKKNRVLYLSFLTIIIVEIAVFWRTQSMGWHHRLIVNVPLVMIFIMTWDFYHLTNLETHKYKNIVIKTIVALCSIMLIFNFYQAYIPLSSQSHTNGMFSAKYVPMKRGDIDELEKLVKYLNDITAETEDGIYVAASGTNLNSDILRKFYMPYSNNAVPNLYLTSDVDLRDGFPEPFLYADYVVATDPIELHLMTGQEVVSYLSAGIQDQTSFIGRHFEEINRFELDNEVIGKVYRKISDWEESDLEQLRSYYGNLYPEHKELFIDRINYAGTRGE